MIRIRSDSSLKGMQAVLLAVCILSFCGPAMAQSNLAQGVPVVLAPRQDSVLAAERDSRVTVIDREFGQVFKKGTVLVRLDSRSAVLGVRRAKATLEEALKKFSIMQEMHKSKSVSTLELEEARSKQLVAEVDLSIARLKLARCTVKAPFAGRVARVLAREHEWVETGDPLMQIVDDSVLLAKFLLPSAQYGQVKPGDKVAVSIEETGQTYEGVISHMGAEVDPSSRSFELYAEVKNDSSLRGGMRGTIVMQEQ